MKARHRVIRVFPVCIHCVEQLCKPPYTADFAMKRLRDQMAVERLYRWALFGW